MTKPPKFRLTRPDLAAKNCEFLNLSFKGDIPIVSFKRLFPNYKKQQKNLGVLTGLVVYKRAAKQHILNARLTEIAFSEEDMVSFTIGLGVTLPEEPIAFKPSREDSLDEFYEVLAILSGRHERYTVDIMATFTYPKDEFSGLGFPRISMPGPPSFEVLGVRFKVQYPEKGSITIIIDTTSDGGAWHNISMKSSMTLSKKLADEALKVASGVSRTFTSKMGGPVG